MSISLEQVQQQIGGEIRGDKATLITGVNSLETAKNGDVCFAESRKYLDDAKNSEASVLIVPPGFPDLGERTLLVTEKPRELFLRIMVLFDEKHVDVKGIHETASVHPEATIAANVALAENVVVRAGAVIGENTCIESGVHVARGVTIGRDCWIGPNVTLGHNVVLGDRVVIHAGTVVGGEGFGYVWMEDHHHKVPQLGTVEVGDDVEIGSNTCIDRATFGATRIGSGSKIDNLVQIAHNNQIGQHTILVSQVGLAGSSKIGNRVTLAGQVGVADHITINDGATALARTGISKDIAENEVVWGAPNRPVKQVMKEYAAVARLPKLFEQVKQLTEIVKKLQRESS